MITAMQFLFRHNFRIEDALNSGVRYLSREEEAQERRIEAQLRDKDDAPVVQLDPNDTVSLEFMHRVRQEVMAWKSRSTVRTRVLYSDHRLTFC